MFRGCESCCFASVVCTYPPYSPPTTLNLIFTCCLSCATQLWNDDADSFFPPISKSWSTAGAWVVCPACLPMRCLQSDGAWHTTTHSPGFLGYETSGLRCYCCATCLILSQPRQQAAPRQYARPHKYNLMRAHYYLHTLQAGNAGPPGNCQG